MLIPTAELSSTILVTYVMVFCVWQTVAMGCSPLAVNSAYSSSGRTVAVVVDCNPIVPRKMQRVINNAMAPFCVLSMSCYRLID